MASRLIPITTSFALALVPALVARAGGERPTPIAYAERELTLPAGQLVANTTFWLVREAPATEMAYVLAVGADFGVTTDLTIGAVPLSLRFAPDAAFGDPSVYARYRFFGAGAPLELALQVGLDIPIAGGAFALTSGLRLRAHLSDAVRLDLGLSFPLEFTDPISAEVALPFGLAVSVTHQVFVVVEGGLVLHDFDPEELTLGLCAHLGYTFAKNAGEPRADVFLGVALPDANLDAWWLLVSGRLFL